MIGVLSVISYLDANDANINSLTYSVRGTLITAEYRLRLFSFFTLSGVYTVIGKYQCSLFSGFQSKLNKS